MNNLKFLIDVIWPIIYFKEFYLVKDIIKGWNCNHYFRNARKVPFSIFTELQLFGIMVLGKNRSLEEVLTYSNSSILAYLSKGDKMMFI